MNFRDKDKLAGEIDDPVLAQALKHFKASVDAWSEAAYSRPRAVVRTARHSSRRAAGWALGSCWRLAVWRVGCSNTITGRSWRG